MKDKKTDIKVLLTNLKTPMPWHRKVYKIFKNNFIKLITLKNCCGHPGEPGC